MGTQASPAPTAQISFQAGRRAVSALRKLAAVAAILALTHAAEAMDYHYDVIKGRLMLRGDGDIEVDEGKRFLAFTADLPAHLFAMFDGTATLVLDLRGGNLAAGFVLAHIVWSFHLTTDVSYAGQCASACVVAWAAGAHKQMEKYSRIGVHQVSLNGTAIAGVDGPTADSPTPTSWRDGSAPNPRPDNVVAKTIETPAASMYWLTPDDLKAWKVGVTPTSEEDDARLDDRSCWAKPEGRFICAECDEPKDPGEV